MKFLSQKLRSSADFYSQIALILVIVLLINIIFTFLPFRFDITEARIYSISTVTKETLKELDDIVTLKAYFTENLPGYFISVRQQVRDMLAEYKNYGTGNIRVTFVDPSKDPELEQEARSLGIPPMQFNIVEKDKLEVAQGYLGIAVLYANQSEILPVVQNTSTLEYDLTSAIKKIISGKTFKVGILQKDDVLVNSSQLQLLQQILNRQYVVELVDLADNNLINDGITTLIILQPKAQLSDRELYIIDQFVMSGKGVLFAIDGVNVEQGLIPSKNESNIFDLLSSYEITINKDLVFDPVSRAQASFSSPNGFMQFFTPYSFWPQIPTSGFNQENVLVNKLESLVLPWVSTITGGEQLVSTSFNAHLVTDNFDLNPQSRPAIGDDAAVRQVAVLINQKIASHFNKAIPKPDEESVQEQIIGIENPRVIVIADGDLVTDAFIQRYESNIIFLQNIIDGLTLDQSLAQIRSKTITERPIKSLDDTARSLVKYLNIIGVPIIVVLFAVVRFVWRRKSQRVGTDL